MCLILLSQIKIFNPLQLLNNRHLPKIQFTLSKHPIIEDLRLKILFAESSNLTIDTPKNRRFTGQIFGESKNE